MDIADLVSDDYVELTPETRVSKLVGTFDGEPDGLITKTDLLDALTWEAEGNRAVQVYGTDLLDDILAHSLLVAVPVRRPWITMESFSLVQPVEETYATR